VTTTLPDEPSSGLDAEADPASPTGSRPAGDVDGGSATGEGGGALGPSGTTVAVRSRVGWLGRVLPGLWFPVAVWLVWRLASLVVTLWLGGRGVESAYAYDGAHYLRIVHHGYWDPRPIMPSHAFFPGVSWLSTPVWWLTGSDAVTAHAVASATGLAAFVTLWGVTREWLDERGARRAVVLLALFPSSLFLWMFYSEALFIALGAGAVWADRRGHRWIAAACFAGLATTRSVGILVPAVIVLARIVRSRRVDRWSVVYAGAGAAGLAAVMFTMWRQVGDPVAFLGVQSDWGRNVSWPWASVLQGFDNLTPDARTVMVPALVARNLDLWSVAIVLVGIGYLVVAGRLGRGGRSARARFPMEAWMLGVAMVALPLASSALASFNRFTLANWVIYPAYASMLGRLPTWARVLAWIAIAVASVLTAYALIGRVSVGRFVG
jgi:hypothetical protein